MLSVAPEDKSRLQDYCAVSVFVKTLMLRGYSFDETTFPRISFQKKVWTVSLQKNKHKMTFITCQTLLIYMDPPGQWCLGGLGPRLHARFEQFAAIRDSSNKEKSESAGVGNTSVSYGIPAGRSSVIHLHKGLFYQEGQGNRPQTSGLPWAQHYLWEPVNGIE